LSTLVGLLNADPTFSINFEAVETGTSLKIRVKTSFQTSSEIAAGFTVSSLPNNLPGSSVQTIVPVLTEYADGSENVSASVFWENALFGTRTTDSRFTDCVFEYTPLAVECRQFDLFSTSATFNRCRFYNCDTGIYITGVSGQGNDWAIVDSEFEQVAHTALVATHGRGTKVSRTKFKNVGTNTSTSQYPIGPIVKFGESINNIVVDCSSDRHQLSSFVTSATVESIAEFENAAEASLVDKKYSLVYLDDGLRPLSIFPAKGKTISVDYILTLGAHSRIGQLMLIVNSSSTSVSMTDNYSYSSGGDTMVDFEFAVELRDNNDDTINDTILLRYRNPLAAGLTGSISYSITYGV
jgi:hypothetical protein